MYVIKNNDNGRYVARSGSASSFAASLKNARKFESREQAERERCGNERIIPLEEILDEYRR